MQHIRTRHLVLPIIIPAMILPILLSPSLSDASDRCYRWLQGCVMQENRIHLLYCGADNGKMRYDDTCTVRSVSVCSDIEECMDRMDSLASPVSECGAFPPECSEERKTLSRDLDRMKINGKPDRSLEFPIFMKEQKKASRKIAEILRVETPSIRNCMQSKNTHCISIPGSRNYDEYIEGVERLKSHIQAAEETEMLHLTDTEMSRMRKINSRVYRELETRIDTSADPAIENILEDPLLVMMISDSSMEDLREKLAKRLTSIATRDSIRKEVSAFIDTASMDEIRADSAELFNLFTAREKDSILAEKDRNDLTGEERLLLEFENDFHIESCPAYTAPTRFVKISATEKCLGERAAFVDSILSERDWDNLSSLCDKLAGPDWADSICNVAFRKIFLSKLAASGLNHDSISALCSEVRPGVTGVDSACVVAFIKNLADGKEWKKVSLDSLLRACSDSSHADIAGFGIACDEVLKKRFLARIKKKDIPYDTLLTLCTDRRIRDILGVDSACSSEISTMTATMRKSIASRKTTTVQKWELCRELDSDLSEDICSSVRSDMEDCTDALSEYCDLRNQDLYVRQRLREEEAIGRRSGYVNASVIYNGNAALNYSAKRKPVLLGSLRACGYKNIDKTCREQDEK